MKPIHVIGLGVADKAQFDSLAQLAFEQSDIVIGSNRQLEVVEDWLHGGQQTIILPLLTELKALLEQHQDKSITMLASGDPLHYGIGRWLVRTLGIDRLDFYPAVSSVQAACHALGLALQDVEVLSLHGRPVEKIRSKLCREQLLVVLTDKNSQPVKLAQECISVGLGHSRLWVCELLGYPQQRIREFGTIDLVDNPALTFDPLHVTVIQTKGQGYSLPEFPGFEDTYFATGDTPGTGMITKREVRLAILSLMQPTNHDVIWDIGAGCGSVAVELAYWNETVQVYAIEHHVERLSCLAQNRRRFGVVSNLNIIEGRAPECLVSLPVANKVFIGGSDGEMVKLLQLNWQQLPEDGILVVSCVTENTKMQLLQFAAQLEPAQTETLQIAVSKGTTLAGQQMYKPNLPVTLFKFTKY